MNIIKTIILSFIFIFLSHNLYLFFKNNLTVPKVKDLVNGNDKKYHDMFNVINTENNNDNNHENNSSKNSNQLSRTERAINAKLKRFNKNSNEKDFEEKSDKPIAQKNIDKEGKTSDGVEALRAFATNIDTQ